MANTIPVSKRTGLSDSFKQKTASVVPPNTQFRSRSYSVPSRTDLAEPVAGKTVLVAPRHSGFTLDRKYEYEGVSAVKNKLVVVTCENVGVFVCKAEVFEQTLDRIHSAEYHEDIPYIQSSVTQGFIAFPSTVIFSNQTVAYSGSDISSLSVIPDPEGVLKGSLLYSHASFHGKQFYVLRLGKGPQDPPNVYDVDQVTLSLSKEPLSRVIFQICHLGVPRAFDVSEDGEYFAVMRSCPSEKGESLHVNVYRRYDSEPVTFFCASSYRDSCRSHAVTSSTLCPASNDVTGDVCFSKYRGREVLRVAVSQDNCVYVLDHLQDGKVLTVTEVFRPRRITSGEGGQPVWILCDQQVLCLNTA